MATATLTIDLTALTNNWRALDAMTGCETAAVVKADGYGLGADRVARSLANAGARTFFVAATEEAASLRQALGPGPVINIFSGHMAGDTDMISDLHLTPMLNSIDQMLRHVEALPDHPFGIQLDTGMNRLGMEPGEWAALRELAEPQNPTLVMSHLACADEPDHPMNAHQLESFLAMTEGMSTPKSLSATGGILLGKDYHFDMTRPGVGLYGGLPFEKAEPVAHVSIPVIQVRDVAQNESVGYGNTWIAERDSRIATVAAGYADGLIRAMGPKMNLFHGSTACPIVGRISMDMIGVDITHLGEDPRELDILTEDQTVDHLADAAGTIGYEILTSLGARYQRRYSS
ncbi:alanine racemase [Cognatishimia activa]|uniref:Alanine racemase n=1 Tax=Cognatishimia activa TaxID=1715691 RepID=A0A975ENX4_9RHOB|nr:alanine racemase [Cognatishimia activa]QTN35493.1 alanine racemase [Cognatishimia activa]